MRWYINILFKIHVRTENNIDVESRFRITFKFMGVIRLRVAHIFPI